MFHTKPISLFPGSEEADFTIGNVILGHRKHFSLFTSMISVVFGIGNVEISLTEIISLFPHYSYWIGRNRKVLEILFEE
ncbi:MAG: hypothetical protein WC140_04320 [Bacteroidales bacterium]